MKKLIGNYFQSQKVTTVKIFKEKTSICAYSAFGDFVYYESFTNHFNNYSADKTFATVLSPV